MKRSDHTLLPTPSASWLSAFCSHLIEACWLIAVVAVPLLYDPHATNGFDPIKLALMRTLGLIVAGALAVRAVEFISKSQRGSDLGSFLRLPSWLLAGVALLIAFSLASVLSVDPVRSFWGSPQFIQGTFTLFCNLALFAGVATHLRSKEQLDRLVIAALAASAPVAIYALLQRAHMDPIVFAEGNFAAISFAGQPIYLAGYLLMLMPLCVWKLWRSLETQNASRLSVPRLFFSLLLLLQFSAFVATEKRGPFVALVISGACGLVLMAAYWKRFRLAARASGVAAAMALLLLVLAALGKVNPAIHQVPLLGRLSLIVPLGTGTGDWFRSNLWSAAPPMVTAADPFVFPDGIPDPWRMMRPFVGYGPETLPGVLPQTWSFIVGGPIVKRESRFHSGFWDTWQAVGLIGLAAFLWFYLSVYSAGCRSLGLFEPNRNADFHLGAAALGMGLVAGWLMALIYGAGYFGLGFSLGFAAGLLGWTFWNAFRNPNASKSYENVPQALLIIAFLSALLGHWVDLALAFQTGNTLVLFWIFSGVIAGSGLRNNQPEAAAFPATERTADKEEPARTMEWTFAGLLAGLLSGIMLIVLLNAFIDARSLAPLTTWDVLHGSLTQIRFNQGASYLIPLLLLPSWMGGIFFLLSGMQIAGEKDRYLKAFVLAAVLSLGIGAAFGILKAFWIASIGPVPSDSDPAMTAFAQAARLEVPGPFLLVLCVLGAAAIAAVLFSRVERPDFVPVNMRGWVSAGLAGFSVCAAIWFTAASIPRNEAWNSWGDFLHQSGRKNLAVEVYQRALSKDPTYIPTRILCANALLELAERNPDDEAFHEKMGRAESLLLDGIEITKLNAANYHLGRLYLRWALHEPDETARKSLASRAKEAFRRAIRFSPKTEAEWVEASIVDDQLFGDTESADKKLKIADELVQRVEPPLPNISPIAWGDFHAYQSFSSRHPHLKEFYALRAIQYFDRAVDEEREAAEEEERSARAIEKSRRRLYGALITKAKLQRRILGQREAAIVSLQEATDTQSDPGTWEAEALLAQAYAEIGNRAAALQEIAKSLESAPPETKQELLNIQRKISADPSPQP